MSVELNRKALVSQMDIIVGNLTNTNTSEFDDRYVLDIAAKLNLKEKEQVKEKQECTKETSVYDLAIEAIDNGIEKNKNNLVADSLMIKIDEDLVPLSTFEVYAKDISDHIKKKVSPVFPKNIVSIIVWRGGDYDGSYDFLDLQISFTQEKTKDAIHYGTYYGNGINLS